MSTLLEKANSILQDKDVNLISENLKGGVTCLGVKGNYDPVNTYFNTNTTRSNYKYINLEKKNPVFTFTSDTVSLNGMFKECNLKEIDLTGFDFNNVTALPHFCESCTKLEKFSFGNANLTKITDLASFFKNCTSIKEIDISTVEFDNITYKTDMFANIPANCEIIVKNQYERDNVLSIRGDLTNVHYKVDKLFFAPGNMSTGKCISSIDGITLSESTINSYYILGYASKGNRAVAMCHNYGASERTYPVYSSDGVTWNNTITVTNKSFVTTSYMQNSASCNVTYKNGRFYTVAWQAGYSNDGGSIVYSDDGIDWVVSDVALQKLYPDVSNWRNFYIDSNNSIILIVNHDDGYGYYSSDGFNWDRKRLWESTSRFVRGCVATDGGFVLLNGYELLFIDNNCNVIRRIPSDDISEYYYGYPLTSFGYHNGTYLVGGPRGIFRSIDLDTWTNVLVKTTGEPINNIAYFNNNFVAIGTSKFAKYSTDDGLTWNDCLGTISDISTSSDSQKVHCESRVLTVLD